MLRNMLVLIITMFNVFTHFANTEFVHRMKRADIDLQTCIDNFDIHKDKIIRTQDSQNMGAKYLNEIDLGDRIECLRLCCETDLCDVFVYEEKKSGSCYLFHCGPPEDFKCKFTHHVNYTSAVLAVSRHLPDLESQIKLTKHEQDLSKLRKVESQPEVLPQIQQPHTFPPSTTIVPIKTKEVLPDIVSKAKPTKNRRCSPYQFECRSTGECIAIYNACDGIPQCADGSDEATELECPDQAATTPGNPVKPGVPGPASSFQQSLSRPNHESPASPPNMYRQAGNPPEIVNPRLPSLLSRQPPDPPDFIRPEPRFPVYESPPRLPYEGQQFQQYPQHQPGWGRQVGQMAQPYADKNSHIFTHKDNGIQVADGQDLSPVQYGDVYNSRDYAKNPVIPPYYDTAYRPNLQQDNWKKPQDGSRFSNINYSQERVNKDWRKDNKQEGIPGDQKIPQTSQKSTSDESAVTGNEKNVAAENPKHVQEKLAHELKHSSKTQANQVEQPHVESTKEPVIKIEKHVPAKPHEPFPDVVAFKIPESTDTEGIPHKSGAVLSLTLGLIITCIMAILLGCRLRVVRRRIRKGGKSYAHDADYLVNGMYL